MPRRFLCPGFYGREDKKNISLSIFLLIEQKEFSNTKAQLWCFLINKLVSATPQTNNTWRKLRSSAFHQGLGVADRDFIAKY